MLEAGRAAAAAGAGRPGRADLRRPAPPARGRPALRRADRRDHRRATTTRPGCGSPTAATLPADVVIVGVGITPNTHLAGAGRVEGRQRHLGRRAPAHLRRRHLRRRGRRQRLPPAAAAGTCGSSTGPTPCTSRPVAAKTMLGQDAAYDRLPYFFTDQYDLGMEYTGYAEPGGYDQVVIRGDVDSGEFIAFWLQHGRRAGRDERQHLGRHRHHRSADQNRPTRSTPAGSPIPGHRWRHSSSPDHRSAHPETAGRPRVKPPDGRTGRLPTNPECARG